MAQSDTTTKTTRATAAGRKAKPAAVNANAAPTKSKKARLQAPEGASLDQLVIEFGWQPHTVRAAISGLRMAGLDVQRDTGEAASIYRIVASGAT